MAPLRDAYAILKYMNRGGHRPNGYTIVEVIIFLAVSGALLISALGLINGQQQRTEFVQSVRDFDNDLQDIANDVSTGYFNNAGNFSCTVAGSTISFTSTAAEQGTNMDCIFVGKLVQFQTPGTNELGYRIYTMVGARQTGSPPREVTSFAEAKPVVIARATSFSNTVESFEDKRLGYGAKFGAVNYNTSTPVGMIGFITSFGALSGVGNNLSSGTTKTTLIPIGGTSLGQDVQQAAAAANTAYLSPLTQNPSITICLLSTGSDQHAIITMGGNANGTFSSEVTVQGGSACP